jgi:hypothetical protein
MKSPKRGKNIFDSASSDLSMQSELPANLNVQSLLREMEAMKKKNQELEARLTVAEQNPNGLALSKITGLGMGIPCRNFPASSSDKWNNIDSGLVEPKYTKLTIGNFTGKEIHPGLSPNFHEWGENFVRQLNTMQNMVRQCWSEDLKIQILGSKLEGAPLVYYNQHLAIWAASTNEFILDFVMRKLDLIYSKKITVDRGMELLRKPKPANRSWKDHLVYLGAVNVAMGGGQEAAVLQSLVKHAKPSLANTLGMFYNKYRTDYDVMALEIVDRAEDKDPTSETKIGRVNNVRQKKCFNCNRTGHIAKYCKSRIKGKKVNSVYDQDGNVGGV